MNQVQDLESAMAAVWEAFGRGRVSPDLEVCTCPVCMTDETRAQIVATPADKLSPRLIGEYSNSAHGVPRNLGDLTVLLPRYLEMLAEGEAVDSLQVSTELLRFGQAHRAHADWLTKQQRAALDGWLLAMVRASAGRWPGAGYLFDMASAGPWLIDQITKIFDAAFDDDPKVFAGFASEVLAYVRTWNDKVAPDWFAIGYRSSEDRAAAMAWLNHPDMIERSILDAEAAEDPALKKTLTALFDLTGRFDAGLLPDHKPDY